MLDLKVGLHSWGYAAPPLPDPAGLLLVLSEYPAVCFSFPFPLFLQPLLPMPHVALGDAVEATRGDAPAVPGVQLPRCNSTSIYAQPSQPPTPLEFSRAVWGSRLKGTPHGCRGIRGRVRARGRGRTGRNSWALTTPFCFILRGKLLAEKRRCG